MNGNAEAQSEEWLPSPLFEQATVPHYLFDGLMHQRLSADYSDDAQAIRAPYQPGKKEMDESEREVRKLDFFEQNQLRWSIDFIERLRNAEDREPISPVKSHKFIRSFKNDWVDGHKRRQESRFMVGLKKSIFNYYKIKRFKDFERRVIERLDSKSIPFFDEDQMAKIFEINKGMVQTYLEDYLEQLGHDGPPSLSHLYVRRGVLMPKGPLDFLKEKHYLSSYSLALGPVELFAQTQPNQRSRDAGRPCILSAPIGAIQDRIVAFAPFICGMEIDQLEFIVAPPIADTRLKFHGVHGGIEEYSFE